MLAEIDAYIAYLKYEKNMADLTISSYYNDLIQLYDFFLNVSNDPNSQYELTFEVVDEDIEISEIQKEDLVAYIMKNVYDIDRLGV